MESAPTLTTRVGARRTRTTFVGAALCAAAQLAAAQAVEPHDGLHDFDFVIGRWNAHLLTRPA